MHGTSCNWNVLHPNMLTKCNWRASLVPAAAAIPAPIAYIKVVAVKKLVVEVLVVWASALDATEPAIICLQAYVRP